MQGADNCCVSGSVIDNFTCYTLSNRLKAIFMSVMLWAWLASLEKHLTEINFISARYLRCDKTRKQLCDAGSQLCLVHNQIKRLRERESNVYCWRHASTKKRIFRNLKLKKNGTWNIVWGQSGDGGGLQRSCRNKLLLHYEFKVSNQLILSRRVSANPSMTKLSCYRKEKKMELKSNPHHVWRRLFRSFIKQNSKVFSGSFFFILLRPGYFFLL